LNIKTENVESLNVSAAVAIAMYKIRGGFWK
jgi:tRNA G18 (ribose-2'-O)-methylase SpoU